jgi:putative flavoprotein involved in K+ transport
MLPDLVDTIVIGAGHADQERIYFHDDVMSNIRFADEASEKIKLSIDEFVRRSGYQMPENEEDPDDIRFESGSYAGISHVDLDGDHISTIIWTCGFTGDFSYLKLPVYDSNGLPEHNNGISHIKGLYFIGIPWMRKRKSGIVMGIKEDAEFIAGNLLHKRFTVA